MKFTSEIVWSTNKSVRMTVKAAYQPKDVPLELELRENFQKWSESQRHRFSFLYGGTIDENRRFEEEKKIVIFQRYEPSYLNSGPLSFGDDWNTFPITVCPLDNWMVYFSKIVEVSRVHNGWNEKSIKQKSSVAIDYTYFTDEYFSCLQRISSN